MGPAAVDCLRNLEKNYTVTAWTLSDLRAVATPDAANKLVPVMMQTKIGRKDVDAAIRKVVHDMYVDWCWSEENPFIHPDRGMLLPSSGRLSVQTSSWDCLSVTAVFFLNGFLCEFSHKFEVMRELA